MCPGNTVVEHATNYYEIMGSNLTTGTGREIIMNENSNSPLFSFPLKTATKICKIE
jgi:hypothetical protein